MIEYTYEEAIDTVLKMKDELGHMPTEKDYKKDNTVSLEGLEKALKVKGKGFSAVNITVLREIRRQEGRSVKILPDNKSKKTAEKRAKRRERERIAKEKAAEKKQKTLANVREKPYALVAMKKKEVEEMAEKRRYRRWTEEEIAKIIKDFFEKNGRWPKDFEISYGGDVFASITENTPSLETVRKILGRRREEWAASINRILGCETCFTEEDTSVEAEAEIEAELARAREATGALEEASETENDDALSQSEGNFAQEALAGLEAEKTEVRCDEYYERLNAEDFFNSINFVTELARSGKIKEMCSNLGVNISLDAHICTEIDGMKMYFVAIVSEKG